MDIITISIGAIIILFGIYTLYARIITPEKFDKLQAMKGYFGLEVGTIIHTIAYSIVPLGVGVSIIYAGVKGISIIQLLAIA